MRLNWSRVLIATLSCALGVASPARAADATAQYSDSMNPGRLWSYGYTTAIGAPFQVFTDSTQEGPLHFWSVPVSGTPRISVANQGAHVTQNDNHWRPGELVALSGAPSQYTVVRFRAPSDGTFSFGCTFASINTTLASCFGAILVNSQPVATAIVHGPAGVDHPVALSATAELHAGDTIDFAAAVLGSGPPNYGVALRNARVEHVTDANAPIPRFTVAQPWAPGASSHPSSVIDCSGQIFPGHPPVATDDWIAPSADAPVHAVWWGTTPQPHGVPTGAFLSQIDAVGPGECAVFRLPFGVCVYPRMKPVGVDCLGRTVWRFAVELPPVSFPIAAGGRYAISIAEVDSVVPDPLDPNAPVVGEPDFEWSATGAVHGCPAFRVAHPQLIVEQPLVDGCTLRPHDLAFVLSSRVLKGVLVPAPSAPAIYRVDILRGDGTLEESLAIDPYDDGYFVIDPTVRPGVYDLLISGGPSVGVMLDDVPLGDAGVIDLGLIALPLGNANADDIVDFRDIESVLKWWLSASPFPATPR